MNSRAVQPTDKLFISSNKRAVLPKQIVASDLKHRYLTELLPVL